MTKLALLADIHANYFNLKLVLDKIKEMKIDEYIFLGDYILDGFDNNKVLNLIQSLNATVIMGNKEEFFTTGYNLNWNRYIQYENLKYGYNDLTDNNLKYICSLPKYLIKKVENVKICISHGSPYFSREKYEENDYEKFDKLIEDFKCDVYLFAHTHIAFCTKYKGKYFINVGSVGMPLDGQSLKYGVLTINDKNIEYQQEKIKYDYQLFEKYYKQSRYYKEANIWAKLSLMNIKDGYNYTQEFVDGVSNLAKSLNIDITNGIPNELWIKEYELFIKKKQLENFI